MRQGLPTKDLVFILIQGLLILLFLIPILDITSVFRGQTWKMTGLLLCATGCVMLFFSLIQLNKNLTPFPSPKKSGKLVESGLYHYIRHPIYSGILLMTTGIGLIYNSLWKVTISLLLVILFYFKSVYEEELLSEKYREYKKYKEKTGRFLPRVRF